MVLGRVAMILGLSVLATCSALAEWQIETVDGEGDMGLTSSLVLDAQGYPHIAYQDSGPYKHIRYCFRDAAGWHIEALDSYGTARGGPLVLEQAGYAHIACFRSEDGTSISILHQTAAGWQVEDVAPLSYELGVTLSLALDGQGRWHVSWGELVTLNTKAVLYYAHQEETSWVVETVASAIPKPGPYQSLAVDSSGTPHLAYCDDDSVKYASRVAGLWVIETVETVASGTYPSLVLGTEGAPHIGYSDAWGTLLKYAQREGSTWVIETIDSEGGFTGSLALDRAGYAHLGYTDIGVADYNLEYARQGAGGWRVESVDSGWGESGISVSLALDAEGLAQISYYDRINGDLRYAREVRPIEIALAMPGNTFGEGDPCALDLSAHNLGAEQTVDLYVLLDVFGAYWCYPSWQPLDVGLDHQALTVPAGDSELTLIPSFTLPAVSAGGPFYFYAAMFEEGTLSMETLVSNGAVATFCLE